MAREDAMLSVSASHGREGRGSSDSSLWRGEEAGRIMDEPAASLPMTTIHSPTPPFSKASRNAALDSLHHCDRCESDREVSGSGSVERGPQRGAWASCGRAEALLNGAKKTVASARMAAADLSIPGVRASRWKSQFAVKAEQRRGDQGCAQRNLQGRGRR